MAVLLYRVDERLIHGQVVVGWGASLRPDLIVVVDDDLAGSAWEQELYTLGLPPEVTAAFTTVTEAREALPSWRSSPQRIIVLTRDIQTMSRLATDGILSGEEINLGGIHAAPGRRGVLPYLFLSPAEEEALEELVASGVSVSARDLPSSRRVECAELLGDDVARLASRREAR